MKKNTQSLSANNPNHLKNIIDGSVDGIVTTDAKGNILTVNQSFLNLTGYKAFELLATNLRNLAVTVPGKYELYNGGTVDVSDTTLKSLKNNIKKLKSAKKITGFQNFYFHKNGKSIPVEQSIGTLYDDSGTTHMGYVINVRDISVRHASEKKLTEAFADLENINAQLEKEIDRAHQMAISAEFSNVAKTEFLANMSHEIRTPLNGIIGFTDLLMQSDIPQEQHDYVKTIKDSGDALLSLINDVLDFSKIEAGKASLESIDFDPEILAYNVCDLITPKTADKPIEVFCTVSDDTPPQAKGDPHRLRQVMTNLMGNAVKFTKKGEIELNLSVDETTDGGILLHIKVRDTGIGIPQKQTKIIFDAFKQADGSTTRKFGGTGLGLAICRKIATLMNGRIWVESQKGKGSTFHFTGWLEHASGTPPKRPTHTSLKNKKILIVDDNPTSLNILKKFLAPSQAILITLTDGNSITATLAKAYENKSPFDLCVLNVQLSDNNGYRLATEIRKLEIPQIPLLAFSSHINRDAKKCQSAGFDGYLPKPVNRKKFLTMVESLISDVTLQTPDTRPNTIKTQHSIAETMKHTLNILLVEDNPVNSKLATIMLEKAGYHVKHAVNGKEAIRTYTREPDNFDLILMDIQMPVLDGLAATETLRKKGYSDIPIIAMTANAMEGDRERCITAGMDDYIAKPVKRDKVFDIIRKWVIDREMS